MVDIEAALREISPDRPCGENLEYDPEYAALERAIQGTPEQHFGAIVREAEEPDWMQAQQLAIALLERTKDLRIAAILTRTLVHTEGWSGFHDGLTLTHALLERYWETVHPQLDPDDDNDPTLRINTLIALCDPDEILDPLRRAPLISSRMLGSFSLRDLLIANKELTLPEGDETPVAEPTTIDAALKEVALEELQRTLIAIRESGQRLAAIDSQLLERVGRSEAPDFSALSTLIQTAARLLGKPLAERTGTPEAALDPLAEPSAEMPASQPGVSTVLGAINDRADVIRTLELLCDYYQRQEPSSPIPLLLMRAKRLVAKNFMEILQDLAPDGVSQAEVIRGPEASSDD